MDYVYEMLSWAYYFGPLVFPLHHRPVGLNAFKLTDFFRTGSPKLKPSIRMKGGHGPAQIAQRLPETGMEKRKYPDRSVVLRGKKFLVDARTQRADWFGGDGEETWTGISAHSDSSPSET